MAKMRKELERILKERDGVEGGCRKRRAELRQFSKERSLYDQIFYCVEREVF